MIPINYHHLYYFWTIARAGSIAAATERLYLSQPTLSNQLRELEEFCNAQLFERGRKGIELTDEGKIVFERCERIFAEGDELASVIKNGFKTAALLRVGVQSTIPREAALRVLRFARQAGKSCRVALFNAEADVLATRLKRGALDFVVANEDLAVSLGKDYRSRLVNRLPVFFVGNRATKNLVKRFPADLAKTPLLMRPADAAVRRQVEQYLSSRAVNYRIEAESDDVDMLRRLAIEGNGVAALSSISVAQDVKAGRLFVLHRTPVGIHVPVWFICAVRPRANPVLRRVVEALMGEFDIFGKAPAFTSLLGSEKGADAARPRRTIRRRSS